MIVDTGIKLWYYYFGDYMGSKILLVEDDAFLRDGLCEMLGKEGYIVECASSIAEAKKKTVNEFNLIILDVILPDGNGFEFCESIRSCNIATPILFLTACDDEIQIVRGLDLGADDYVTKPFKLLELMSRVRALLRRNVTGTIIKTSELVIDTQNMTVRRNGENIFVTKTEYQILSTLIRNNSGIVSRRVLLQSIWDDNGNFIDDNTLSVHISRLREKIGANHIKTVRGVGYSWEC